MIESVRLVASSRVLGSIVVIVAGLAVVGCTVDGEATAGSANLSSRSVSAADFPGGSASRVPAPAVPDALADLTGHPLHESVMPAACLPEAVGSDGADVLVGNESTGTFTSAVVNVNRPLADVTDQGRRCPTYVTGASPTAVSTVNTQVLPPPAPHTVPTTALHRVISTGGVGGTGSSSLATGITTLLAQRNGVRVIVEYRQQGNGPVPAHTNAELGALFGKAVRAAFP